MQHSVADRTMQNAWKGSKAAGRTWQLFLPVTPLPRRRRLRRRRHNYHHRWRGRWRLSTRTLRGVSWSAGWADENFYVLSFFVPFLRTYVC